jgi:hypothetical protein
VAQTCDPRFSGGSWFKDSPGKKFTRPYLNQTKQGVVVCTYNSSYVGSIKKRLAIRLPGHKCETLLK